ncbi:unnamed protein product, partial [Discosporangium mesarthrocarpum]
MLLLSGQKVDAIRNTVSRIGVVNRAWRYLEERYRPNSGAEKMSLLCKYEFMKLGIKQDPMDFKADQDHIRDLLRSQGLLVDDTMANTRFLRSLAPEYDVEVRTLLIQDDPTWSDIDRAL